MSAGTFNKNYKTCRYFSVKCLTNKSHLKICKFRVEAISNSFCLINVCLAEAQSNSEIHP